MSFSKLLQSSDNCNRVIFVATNDELNNTTYYRRLWIAAVNKNLSSRKWLDYMNESVLNFEGEIFTRNGIRWPIRCVDDVWGDRRNISNFLQAIDGMPRRKIRMIERLRYMDVTFRITQPSIQSNFGK